MRRGDGRRRLWSLLVAGALALGLAAAPGRPTGAEPMELDAENLLRLAILMIDQGRPRERWAWPRRCWRATPRIPAYWP
ncbi:MAG: hypothetical protein IPF96_20570 [Rhodobacter sp.]|nr:hypothetical protein [Rhodobacter sp.]